MGHFYGTISGSPPSAINILLDLQGATARVANLLRRNTINEEIKQWLNFSLRDLCEEVDFPELRVTGTPINLIASVYKYTLPPGFARMKSVYYKCTSLAPIVGYNLMPLPREFYKGKQVDYERLMNNGNPTKGDPKYYFIDGEYLVIFPVFRDDGATGVLIPTYQRLPDDWVYDDDFPCIDNRWRHHLITLAYYWGMMFEEKEDIFKIRHWENKYDRTILRIARKVNRKEQQQLVLVTPDTGLEDADAGY